MFNCYVKPFFLFLSSGVQRWQTDAGHYSVCVCVCVCVCLWSPSYRTGSNSQYGVDPLLHEPLKMLQATKPLHKSASVCMCACVCVCVCVCQERLCVQICARSIILSSSSTPLSGAQSSRHPLVCHALCTLPLHIFIYYWVFQDQNEWQIGSSEIDLAAESASQPRSRGRRCVWIGGLVQIRVDFCSCLSEAPQVIRWARSDSERGRHGHTRRKRCYGIHSMFFFFYSIQPAPFPLSVLSPAGFSSRYTWSWMLQMHSHTGLHSTAYICSTSRHTDKRLRPQTAKCSRKIPLKSSASWKQTVKLPTSVSSPQDDSAANSVTREQPVLHLNENAISESSHDVITTGKYPVIVLRRIQAA